MAKRRRDTLRLGLSSRPSLDTAHAPSLSLLQHDVISMTTRTGPDRKTLLWLEQSVAVQLSKHRHDMSAVNFTR